MGNPWMITRGGDQPVTRHRGQSDEVHRPRDRHPQWRWQWPPLWRSIAATGSSGERRPTRPPNRCRRRRCPRYESHGESHLRRRVTTFLSPRPGASFPRRLRRRRRRDRLHSPIVEQGETSGACTCDNTRRERPRRTNFLRWRYSLLIESFQPHLLLPPPSPSPPDSEASPWLAQRRSDVTRRRR